MTPKCPDCKLDQEDCICFGSEHQKQTIERQAAQIEMMRSTLHGIVDADWRKWEELASPEEFVRWAKSRANHVLSTTTEQALEQFAAKVREQCAQMLLNGSFLHDQSPARLLAIEAAKAIRAIKELP